MKEEIEIIKQTEKVVVYKQGNILYICSANEFKNKYLDDSKFSISTKTNNKMKN